MVIIAVSWIKSPVSKSQSIKENEAFYFFITIAALGSYGEFLFKVYFQVFTPTSKLFFFVISLADLCGDQTFWGGRHSKKEKFAKCISVDTSSSKQNLKKKEAENNWRSFLLVDVLNLKWPSPPTVISFLLWKRFDNDEESRLGSAGWGTKKRYLYSSAELETHFRFVCLSFVIIV